MITPRFLRATGLLAVGLLLLSASLNAALDRLEQSPRQSQLAIIGQDGRIAAVYQGNLAELGAAEAANAKPAGWSHHLRTMVEQQLL